MKRVVVVLLAIVLVLGLAGCGFRNPLAPSGAKKEAPKVEEPVTEEQPVAENPTTPSATQGERNALKSAESYLSVMPFSHSGLIQQLEYEGYTNEEATYAADNCGANWNEQAAKSAKNYLDIMSFSRQGLIDQLLYEGYSQEQAEYGVSAAGY